MFLEFDKVLFRELIKLTQSFRSAILHNRHFHIERSYMGSVKTHEKQEFHPKLHLMAHTLLGFLQMLPVL